MDKNNKKNNIPKPRTDRGTYDKEKKSEKNRWKQNLKNYMTSTEEDDLDDDFEEFE
jgi:hypothetical protein